jgi:hypothetical protein
VSDLREELLRIRANYGRLTPQAVVDAARDPDHVLHSRFEWDDQLAGEAYRRQQAHEMIKRVKVVYREPDENGPARSVRAFHSVADQEGYAFQPAESVREDPFQRQLVLRSMEREWKAMYRRYQEFQEFLDLVRADVAESAAA